LMLMLVMDFDIYSSAAIMTWRLSKLQELC